VFFWKMHGGWAVEAAIRSKTSRYSQNSVTVATFVRISEMIVDLHTAVRLLAEGKVVALPTETVYGLACLATNADAIAEVYRIKQRPADNPLICHVDSAEMMWKYAEPPAPWVEMLVRALAPGPVSFLLPLNPGPGQQLKAATGGRPGVVMRIPEHPVTLEVISKLGEPIAAPSANTSGKVSPTSADMVLNDLGEKVAGVLDGGPCEVGIESSILDVRDPDCVRIVRPGKIGVQEVRSVLQEHFPEVRAEEMGQLSETVPGSKYAHYAPETPVFWRDRNAGRHFPENEAVLGMREALQGIDAAVKVDLGSLHDDPEAVARELYRNLKSLDDLPVKRAWLLRFDPGDSAIGQAVLNRLEKVARSV
jgi:L-threonylcarbamoyladenylate synthase